MVERPRGDGGVIMLSVPPALAGGILGLEVVNRTLTYQPLDILTMLGFVILIGVVVNNAILIVHQTRRRLRRYRAAVQLTDCAARSCLAPD